MRRYEFPLTLQGFGLDIEDAWENALEGFVQDPGSVPEEAELIEVLDEDLYSVTDWQQEVANGDTILGYVDWVEHKIEIQEAADAQNRT